MLISLCATSLALFILSSYLGYTFFFKLVSYENTHDKFATLFLSSLLGFLLGICGYAIAIKGIYTIMLIPFVTLLIASFCFFSPKVLPFSKEAFYSIILLWGWSIYFNYITNVSQDVLFYSLIAKSISILPENYFLTNNLLSASFQGTTSYHYGEMWATSLLLFFSKSDSVEAMAHIVYPIASFLCVLGMIASTSNTLVIWKRIVYGTVLIFVSATFYSLKPHSFFLDLNIYLFSITNEVFYKLLFILPLSIATAWWLKRRIEIAFLVLFQLPIFSFVTTPAVYGGAFLTLLILIFTKKISVKIGYALILILFAHVAAMALFYYFSPSPTLSGWDFIDLMDFYRNNLSYSLITLRNILIGQLILILISCLPCMALFILLKTESDYLREHQIALLLSSCITLCAVFAFALLFPVRDSVELSQVVWTGVSYILLLTVLASKAMSKVSQLVTAISLIAICNGTSAYIKPTYTAPYSSEFITSINHSFKEKSILKIGSIRKDDNVDCYFLYLQPILPFKNLPNFLGCIPMSRPRPLLTDILKKFRALDIEQESAFYEYLVAQKGGFWGLDSNTWENACCAYADSVQLDAVIIEKGAPLPSCLRQRAKQEIFDSISQERLLVF